MAGFTSLWSSLIKIQTIQTDNVKFTTVFEWKVFACLASTASCQSFWLNLVLFDWIYILSRIDKRVKHRAEEEMLYFSVSTYSYVKNSKLCNNLTQKGFTATQKLTFISFSASWCCVNKAAACVLSYCTHSVTALLLCIAFCFCGLCKLMFLLFCEPDHFSCVVRCKRTAVLKEPLGKSRAIVTL